MSPLYTIRERYRIQPTAKQFRFTWDSEIRKNEDLRGRKNKTRLWNGTWQVVILVRLYTRLSRRTSWADKNSKYNDSYQMEIGLSKVNISCKPCHELINHFNYHPCYCMACLWPKSYFFFWRVICLIDIQCSSLREEVPEAKSLGISYTLFEAIGSSVGSYSTATEHLLKQKAYGLCNLSTKYGDNSSCDCV